MTQKSSSYWSAQLSCIRQSRSSKFLSGTDEFIYKLFSFLKAIYENFGEISFHNLADNIHRNSLLMSLSIELLGIVTQYKR